MIRYSSFNYVALLHSLLANISAHRSREWGTIAAVVRPRPPWFIVFWQTMTLMVCLGRQNILIPTYVPIIDASKKELQIFAILAAGSLARSLSSSARENF